MDNHRVAVITGASQGIGAGLVEAYRSLGYAVVANSRTVGASQDDLVAAVPGDISDPAVADRVIETAVERFGRVDTLVNNAGIFIAKPFLDYTRDDFDQALAVTLGGFFHVTQNAVAQMSTQRSGHVVNITTSLVEYANSSVPSALASLTKGGTAAVIKSLAIEFASQGVRFNAVSPGIIKTPLHAEETHETYAALHPLGRMGTIDDIVHGVIYLEQAPFVTGEFLHVDGGQSAGN